VIDRYDYAEYPATEGTEQGISNVMKAFGDDYRYIVCAQDIHCFPEDFAQFARESCSREAIHWGVFQNEPTMSDYDGLVVDPRTFGVMGDVSRNIAARETFIKGAIHSIVPHIFEGSARERTQRGESGDFYWDYLPSLYEKNRGLCESGQAPILRAVPFRRPIFDYGTPRRPDVLRQRLSPPPHVTHARV